VKRLGEVGRLVVRIPVICGGSMMRMSVVRGARFDHVSGRRVMLHVGTGARHPGPRREQRGEGRQ
jgi:hypothetical protein